MSRGLYEPGVDNTKPHCAAAVHRVSCWPAFERLCDTGARFERAYSVCPVCTPARASMMTGQYPFAHGLRWNDIEMPTDARLYSHYLGFWNPHHPYAPSEPFAGSIPPAEIPPHPTFDDDLSTRPLRYRIQANCHYATFPRRRPWPYWREILRRCYEQTMQLDTAVERILSELQASGQADNTLVIYVADHGDTVSAYGGQWDKASTYTEVVARVPMAIRWPGRIRPGTMIDGLVSNMDVTATMLDAAGVAVPATMHSRSLLPLAAGAADRPDSLLCEHNGHHWERLTQRVLCRGQYKYVACVYDGDELYDLAGDPFGQRNLVDDPSRRDLLRDMRLDLLGRLERLGDRVDRGSMLFVLRERTAK
ncbi:MAG: sulfatase-like hydrolase/transferase [Phycisphaerae bacterium]